ncbi:MAG: type I-B CRISPR-associated endonuclease Cas1b [Bacteroidota bacterium]|nr:type I-B CRISPR-associated endonuclease Cas1b [Bacteroidota bacterium]
MKRPYYIFSTGAIHRRDNTIAFLPRDSSYVPGYETPSDTADEEVIDLRGEDGAAGTAKRIPIADVDSLHVFGSITLNAQALRFLGQAAIPLHVYTHYGQYAGSYYPREYLHAGKLLLAQAAHCLDPGKRLALARVFVAGAVRNMARTLRYYENRGRACTAQRERVEAAVEAAGSAEDIPELRGVEGSARAAYYEAFPAVLEGRFEFRGRVKHPPDNEVNALISFCNALVYSACLSEIYRTQLSPTLSYLHEPGARRHSLALDIAEVFKPLYADRLVFSLVNRQMVGPEDFRRENGACLLNDRGRKTVVEAFEEKMKTVVEHRGLGRAVSYRRLIRLECYKLVKHLLGDEEYKPFAALW